MPIVSAHFRSHVVSLRAHCLNTGGGLVRVYSLELLRLGTGEAATGAEVERVGHEVVVLERPGVVPAQRHRPLATRRLRLTATARREARSRRRRGGRRSRARGGDGGGGGVGRSAGAAQRSERHAVTTRVASARRRRRRHHRATSVFSRRR